jgi:hypothetical protein
MSIDEPHLVLVSFGDPGDEVLDVAKRRADSSHGLAGSEPGFDLQLLAAFDHLEVEVQVLEVPGELAAGPGDADLLGLDLDLDVVGDVHGLGGEDGLHLCRSSGENAETKEKEREEEEEKVRVSGADEEGKERSRSEAQLRVFYMRPLFFRVSETLKFLLRFLALLLIAQSALRLLINP